MTEQAWTTLQKQYPPLRDLLQKMPRRIRERAKVMNFPARKQTARKGEPVRWVDILIDGKMRVLNEFESGDLYSFAYLVPPAYIGSIEVVAQREQFSATTETLEACCLLRLPREDFLLWYDRESWFAREVAKNMAVCLCNEAYKRGEVLFYPSPYIIADYLIGLYDTLEGQPRKVPLGRQEMAEEMGFSVRTVNRCIKTFKEEGLLDIRKGKITLTDSQYQGLRRKNEEIMRQL